MLIEANRSALVATGLASDTWNGKRFDELPTWSYSQHVQARLRSAIQRAASGEPSRYDERVRSTTGELIDVDFSLQPLVERTGSVVYLLASAVIVSERKRTEDRLRKLSRASTILSAIKHQILHGTKVGEILSAACDIVVRQGGFEMAWIGMLPEVGGVLQVMAHSGASPNTVRLVEKLLCADAAEHCAMTMQALHEGRAGVCNDIASDLRAACWRGEAIGRGYRSMASFPLLTRSAVIGTLNVYAGAAYFFDDDEVAFMSEVATDIAFAMEVNAPRAGAANAGGGAARYAKAFQHARRERS